MGRLTYVGSSLGGYNLSRYRIALYCVITQSRIVFVAVRTLTNFYCTICVITLDIAVLYWSRMLILNVGRLNQ